MDRNIWWERFRLKAGTRVMGSVSARCTSAALPPRSQGRGDFELCTHCTAQQPQTRRTLKANRRASKRASWLLHTWILFTLHDHLSQTETLGNPPFSPTGDWAEQTLKVQHKWTVQLFLILIDCAACYSESGGCKQFETLSQHCSI